MNALARIVTACLLATAGLVAQGGGGGSRNSPERMDLLTQSFSLTKEQQKQIKTILDADYKSAAPIREQLKKTRAALGVAFETNKPQADLDEAVQAYAAQVTAMTQAETKALAKLLQALTADQRANQPATQSAVYMMRGIFAGKKWDAVPDIWFY